MVSLLGVVLALGSSGCRHDRPVIAVIPRTTGTLLWEPMHLGAVETARRDGVRVYWNAPADEADLEKQLDELALCIQRRYAGIVFTPDQTVASRSLLLKALQRRIPMVVVDDDPGQSAGPLLSYVSNDEAKGARLAAERVAALLKGKGTIAIVGMYTQSEGGLTRENDFEQSLAQLAPSIQIVERRFGDPNVTHQQQVAQEILETNRVGAIVAMTGAATRGAYYARMASKSKVPIIGFDQELLTPLRTGDVDAVIVQDTRRIGEIAAANIEAEIHGEAVSPLTLVPPILATGATVDSPEIVRLWDFENYRWDQQ